MAATKHVVWDFDGTLAYRPEMWSGAVLAAIRKAGVTCHSSLDDVRPHLRNGFPWHEPLVVRRAGRDADEWWADLAPVLARAVSALTGEDEAAIAGIVRLVREIYTDPDTWRLYDDARAALDAFSRAGWRQILLTNHVPELPAIIAALGISSHFDRVFNSAQTGVEKPHPRAFLQVLELVPSASALWMIGDSLHADVLGAEAAGLNAILVRNAPSSAKHSGSTLMDAFAILERV